MLRSPPLGVRAQIVNGVPAQRARVAAAVLKPLVQAHTVEGMIARPAAFVRQGLVLGDDEVADGTLLLVLEGERDVAPEGSQAVDEVAVLCVTR